MSTFGAWKLILGFLKVLKKSLNFDYSGNTGLHSFMFMLKMRQKCHFQCVGDIIFSVLQSSQLASGEVDCFVILWSACTLLYSNIMAVECRSCRWSLSELWSSTLEQRTSCCMLDVSRCWNVIIIFSFYYYYYYYYCHSASNFSALIFKIGSLLSSESSLHTTISARKYKWIFLPEYRFEMDRWVFHKRTGSTSVLTIATAWLVYVYNSRG